MHSHNNPLSGNHHTGVSPTELTGGDTEQKNDADGF